MKLACYYVGNLVLHVDSTYHEMLDKHLKGIDQHMKTKVWLDQICCTELLCVEA